MLREFAQRIMHWFTGRGSPPEDPFSAVRQPVRRSPPTLSAGVALDEPAPPRRTNVFGKNSYFPEAKRFGRS